MSQKLCAAEVADILGGWAESIIHGWVELADYLRDLGYEVQDGTAEEVLKEFVNEYVG